MVVTGGGEACYSPRWDMNYYVSLANPGVDSNVYSTDNSSGTIVVESGSTYVANQEVYSIQISKCHGICSPGDIVALTLGVGAIIGIVIGVVIFALVTVFGGKKGYDVYQKRKSMGFPDRENPRNPMYRDSGKTGANPFYSEGSVIELHEEK